MLYAYIGFSSQEVRSQDIGLEEEEAIEESKSHSDYMNQK